MIGCVCLGRIDW